MRSVFVDFGQHRQACLEKVDGQIWIAMQVFVVFNVSRPAEVGGAIVARFPTDHLPLEGAVWLVAGESLTTREVGDAIGISDGQNGNAIIVPMEAYWGRAPSHIWEWVGQKRELRNGSA